MKLGASWVFYSATRHDWVVSKNCITEKVPALVFEE